MIISRDFICTNLTGNNNKYWNIRVVQENGEYVFWTEYGRIGDSPQLSPRKVASLDQIEHLIRTKTTRAKNPYKEIEKEVVGAASFGSGAVAVLVAKLFSAASESIKGFLATDLGTMSLAHITRARNILTALGGDDLPPNAFELIEQYYNLIPTVLPRRITKDKFALVLGFMDEIAETEDKLNQVEADIQARSAEADQDTPDYQKALGARLELCQSPDKVIEMVETTLDHRNWKGTKVDQVFEVESSGDRWEPLSQEEPRLLFHGSRMQNWRHILRSGLRIPSSHSNGWAFGPGIYFADMASKSMNYCSYHQDLAVMAVCQVDIGRPYIPKNSDRRLGLKEGYHSTWAKAGESSWLKYNEYIVYTKPQQILKYLVTWRR